jgi:hypothetical protein
MIPAHHRLIPLHAAIAEFDLEALVPIGKVSGMESLHSHFGDREDPLALVFDGDTRWDEEFRPRNADWRESDGALEALVQRASIVVVHGDLRARRIDASPGTCRALFVLGDVHCETMGFWEHHLVHIGGDLHASCAVLATAGKSDGYYADRIAPGWACVRGSAHAPRVQTWFMHLGHLRWREGSGAEFREDVEYEDQDHLWKTDPIW